MIYCPLFCLSGSVILLVTVAAVLCIMALTAFSSVSATGLHSEGFATIVLPTFPGFRR